MYFGFVYDILFDTREKTNRESARIRPSGDMNRICLSSLSQSSFAVLLVPSSGPFGQILSAPQRLPTDLSLPHFETTTRKSYSKILLMIGDWTRENPLTGGAGAPTGFARTVPMKGRAVVLIAGWTLKADNLSGARLCLATRHDGRE
jgi:hypothetical protein